MSGIFAVWSPGQPTDPVILSELAGKLGCRGNQKPTTLQVPGVDFAFCGLSLAKNEPEIHVHGTQVLLLSGWILNQKELGQKLQLSNHNSQQLVLSAYNRWGDQLCHHLIGEYAFIIWDSQSQHLLAATDHFGTRPLFWATTSDGGIAFCNCLSSLTTHPGISSKTRPSAIQDFLVFGYQTDPGSTEYCAVKRVLGGHTLKLTSKGLKHQRYWHPPEPRYIARRPEATIEEFRHTFAEVIGPRLEAKSLSIDLTGGIDSTNNLVMASELNTRSHFQALTSVFEHSAADYEKPLAVETARALKVAHRLVALDRESADRRVESTRTSPLLLSFAGSPEVERHRVAAEFGPVLLSGDGGDPAFANAGWEDMSCSFLRKSLLLFSALGQHFQVWGMKPPGLGLIRRFLPKREKAFAVAPWLVLSGDYLETLEERKLRTQATVRMHPVTSPFWADFFHRKDPAALGVPLHVSFPFFDVRLWEFLNTVIPIPWFGKKALGRLALRGRAPEAVVCRPKTNAAPLGGFYRDWFQHNRRAMDKALDFADQGCPFLDGSKLRKAVERVHTLPHALQWQLFASLAYLRWFGNGTHNEIDLSL